MCQQPAAVKAVCEQVRAPLRSVFPAAEHLKPDPYSLFAGGFKAAQKDLDTLHLRELFRDSDTGGLQEIVGNTDALHTMLL